MVVLDARCEPSLGRDVDVDDDDIVADVDASVPCRSAV